ncbi:MULTISPECIES: Trm112 family protein [Isoptericola]|uniref:Trm112 family protein n=1 Tax=Isoptericola TaxID=254250 RepID=UPI00383A0719
MSETGTPWMDPWVRSVLRCPVTGAELVDAVGPDGEPELHSTDAQRPLAYPVRDGIPVLLEPEARAL